MNEIPHLLIHAGQSDCFSSQTRKRFPIAVRGRYRWTPKWSGRSPDQTAKFFRVQHGSITDVHRLDRLRPAISADRKAVTCGRRFPIRTRPVAPSIEQNGASVFASAGRAPETSELLQ